MQVLSPYQQNSLETAGYTYDMWKSNSVFGNSQGFNMTATNAPNAAEMQFGDGDAIPQKNKAAFDKPDNVVGLSDREFKHRTLKEDKSELNLVYLGLFAVVLAFAFL